MGSKLKKKKKREGWVKDTQRPACGKSHYDAQVCGREEGEKKKQWFEHCEDRRN